MAKAVTHFSNVRRLRDRTITGTLCNRMVGNGDINCTEVEADVTCKLCTRELSYRNRKAA